MNSRALLLSALIAGGVMALLSELPVISIANCLLCIWMWIGGILAVFLYRRFAGAGAWASPLQGLGIGALAGVIGAVLGSILYAIFAPMTSGMLQQIFQSIDPTASSFMDSLPALGGASVAANLLENLLTYVLFGALGGLLAAGLIWKAPREAQQTTI